MTDEHLEIPPETTPVGRARPLIKAQLTAHGWLASVALIDLVAYAVAVEGWVVMEVGRSQIELHRYTDNDRGSTLMIWRRVNDGGFTSSLVRHWVDAARPRTLADLALAIGGEL